MEPLSPGRLGVEPFSTLASTAVTLAVVTKPAERSLVKSGHFSPEAMGLVHSLDLKLLQQWLCSSLGTEIRKLPGAAVKAAKLRLPDRCEQLLGFSFGYWPPDPRKVCWPSRVEPLSRGKGLPPGYVSGWKWGTEAGEDLSLELQN